MQCNLRFSLYLNVSVAMIARFQDAVKCFRFEVSVPDVYLIDMTDAESG